MIFRRLRGGSADNIDVNVNVETKQAEKNLKNLNLGINQFSTRTKLSKNSLLALRGPTAIALAGFTALAIGGYKAVNMASDLNESLAKNRVVFKDHADQIEEWSKTTATAFGTSRVEAVGYAGDIGNLFKTIGIGEERLASMSTEVVELAADLASFHNLAGGTTEALDKLRAGLVGEIEPLRRLGILINESAVKTEAQRLGFEKVNGVLTESQKVQARYSLILKQSTDAQGDFARTSDDFANKKRIVNARIRDQITLLGERLLPLYEDLLDSINKYVIPAFENFIQSIDNVKTAVNFVNETFEKYENQIDNVAKFLGIYKERTDDSTEAVEKQTNAFHKNHDASNDALNSFQGIVHINEEMSNSLELNRQKVNLLYHSITGSAANSALGYMVEANLQVEKLGIKLGTVNLATAAYTSPASINAINSVVGIYHLAAEEAGALAAENERIAQSYLDIATGATAAIVAGKVAQEALAGGSATLNFMALEGAARFQAALGQADALTQVFQSAINRRVQGLKFPTRTNAGVTHSNLNQTFATSSTGGGGSTTEKETPEEDPAYEIDPEEFRKSLLRSVQIRGNKLLDQYETAGSRLDILESGLFSAIGTGRISRSQLGKFATAFGARSANLVEGNIDTGSEVAGILRDLNATEITQTAPKLESALDAVNSNSSLQTIQSLLDYIIQLENRPIQLVIDGEVVSEVIARNIET